MESGQTPDEKSAANRRNPAATAAAVVVLLAIAVFAGVKYKKNLAKPAGFLDSFASCLADKKITMYGAEWCPHCQKEKKAFGDSFRLVPYVECPENTKLCIDKGIEGYPTWILPDGRKLVGEQGLAKLSEASGCPLPEGL